MKKLWEKYREIIVYIIVGLMTTVVSYGVRLGIMYGGAALLSVDLNADHGVATVIRTVAISFGWVAGVLFAFFTNKKWVFRDTVSGKTAVSVQCGKFVASRISTFFVEWGIGALVPVLLIACGYRPFHFVIDVTADIIATAVSIVIVTVLNYILSKLLVFKKKK